MAVTGPEAAVAGSLVVGDQLFDDQANDSTTFTDSPIYGTVAVTSVIWDSRRSDLVAQPMVYNFEVANSHTYFVGKELGGIWVHNDCGLTTVFRAVSPGEATDIGEGGVFNTVPGQMEGKFFAGSAEDATSWGNEFYPDGNYRLVSAEFPSATIDGAYTNPNLDNIGPAWYVECDQLVEASGITFLP